MTTDIELRAFALQQAATEASLLSNEPWDRSPSGLRSPSPREQFDIPKRVEEIYQWLKQSQQPTPTPNPTFPQPVINDGDYTIFADEGRLTISKHSDHGQVGMSLDDLWNDLHQPAPEGRGVAQLQDQAAADPAEEPQETTPQYEALKRAVLTAIRDYYSPNTDSHLVYRTRVFDLIMAGLIRGTWLVQPNSPMPGDCSSFRPADEQPAPVFEPWLVTVLRIDKLNYLMDACKLQGLCESYAKYKAERDALLNGLPSAMPESSPEVKAALAQAADEINPATPQEDLEARRAYEAGTNDYLLDRLQGFSQVVAVMDKLGLDGDAERFRAEEQRLANVLAARGFCLNAEAPAESTGHAGKSLWILVNGGGFHAKAVIQEHTIRPDTNEDCYRVRRGCQYETVWGNDEGVTWAWTRDGFTHPVEAPADPAKRVPQIKDVILYNDHEWLVYHISMTGKKFWAISLGPSENCTELFRVEDEGREHKEDGWTFKD